MTGAITEAGAIFTSVWTIAMNNPVISVLFATLAIAIVLSAVLSLFRG